MSSWQVTHSSMDIFLQSRHPREQCSYSIPRSHWVTWCGVESQAVDECSHARSWALVDVDWNQGPGVRNLDPSQSPHSCCELSTRSPHWLSFKGTQVCQLCGPSLLRVFGRLDWDQKQQALQHPQAPVCEMTGKRSLLLSSQETRVCSNHGEVSALLSHFSSAPGERGRTRAVVKPSLPGCTAGICRAGLGPC